MAEFMELSDIIPFLIVLTILVYVHEWGHYWVAVKSGVRVEVFSIGFGPELFGWYNKAGTRWKISAIPLGGYVKMFGQSDSEADDDVGEDLTDEEKGVSFAHKSLAKRVAIVAAGPFANFIFAIVVFFLLAWVVGTPVPQAGVGQVMLDSPADQAGVLSGDTIVAINDEEITLFSDLQRIVREHPETSIDLYIQRGGENVTVSVRPRGIVGDDGVSYGQLGVSPDPEQVHYERS
ncbi:MAG: PDZ domain-containing protein, partial [Rhodospirillales bacterium]|nr:PDZ domain-containing protein [Rhodospirillales bacterium]